VGEITPSPDPRSEVSLVDVHKALVD